MAKPTYTSSSTFSFTTPTTVNGLSTPLTPAYRPVGTSAATPVFVNPSATTNTNYWNITKLGGGVPNSTITRQTDPYYYRSTPGGFWWAGEPTGGVYDFNYSINAYETLSGSLATPYTYSKGYAHTLTFYMRAGVFGYAGPYVAAFGVPGGDKATKSIKFGPYTSWSPQTLVWTPATPINSGVSFWIVAQGGGYSTGKAYDVYLDDFSITKAADNGDSSKEYTGFYNELGEPDFYFPKALTFRDVQADAGFTLTGDSTIGGVKAPGDGPTSGPYAAVVTNYATDQQYLMGGVEKQRTAPYNRAFVRKVVNNTSTLLYSTPIALNAALTATPTLPYRIRLSVFPSNLRFDGLWPISLEVYSPAQGTNLGNPVQSITLYDPDFTEGGEFDSFADLSTPIPTAAYSGVAGYVPSSTGAHSYSIYDLNIKSFDSAEVFASNNVAAKSADAISTATSQINLPDEITAAAQADALAITSVYSFLDTSAEPPEPLVAVGLQGITLSPPTTTERILSTKYFVSESDDTSDWEDWQELISVKEPSIYLHIGPVNLRYYRYAAEYTYVGADSRPATSGRSDTAVAGAGPITPATELEQTTEGIGLGAQSSIHTVAPTPSDQALRWGPAIGVIAEDSASKGGEVGTSSATTSRDLVVYNLATPLFPQARLSLNTSNVSAASQINVTVGTTTKTLLGSDGYTTLSQQLPNARATFATPILYNSIQLASPLSTVVDNNVDGPLSSSAFGYPGILTTRAGIWSITAIVDWPSASIATGIRALFISQLFASQLTSDIRSSSNFNIYISTRQTVTWTGKLLASQTIYLTLYQNGSAAGQALAVTGSIEGTWLGYT